MEFRDGLWKPSPFSSVDSFGIIKDQFIPIPCGQCIGCRMDYARHWADRLMLEFQCHDSNTCWFLTLTYADENLQEGKHVHFYPDPDTGEVSAKSLSLYKKDLQRFFKLLRYYHGTLKYYACGEYGSLNHRPHYHAIVFGLSLDLSKLVFDGYSKSGLPQWTHSDISKCWITGKGGSQLGKVWLGKVSWNSCAYVARYCTKKVGSVSKDYYESFNIDPEFTCMSKNPAIGKEWYDLHADLVRSGMPIFVSDGKDGSRKILGVRYFDKLLERDSPDDLKRIKELRAKAGQISLFNKMSGEMSYLEQLDIDREVFNARFRKLKREL